MQTVVVIDDDDEEENYVKEFNYTVTKEKYYANLECPSVTHPENIADVVLIRNQIKFGNSINKKRQRDTKALDIIKENGKDILIVKRKHKLDPVLEVIPKSMSFDVIAEAHLVLNHCSDDNFYTQILGKYSMPRYWITTFLEVCNLCSVKSKSLKESTITEAEELTSKEIIHEPNNIVEWSIHKMSNDMEFNYILCYIDVYSCYVILRPLKTAQTEEIAFELLKIFADFGVPKYYIWDQISVYLTDFNQELAVNAIVTMLDTAFPQPFHGPYTFENKLRVTKLQLHNVLFKSINLPHWPVLINKMQWQFNTSYINYCINKTPYSQYLGVMPNIHLLKMTSEIPNFIIEYQKHATFREQFLQPTKPIENKIEEPCLECNELVFKIYHCCSCGRSFHRACCKEVLVKKKPKTITYACASCAKTDITHAVFLSKASDTTNIRFLSEATSSKSKDVVIIP